MGSLKFLRVPVLPNDPKLWHRLQQAPMRPAFESLFQELAVRTTKKEVSKSPALLCSSKLIVTGCWGVQPALTKAIRDSN